MTSRNLGVIRRQQFTASVVKCIYSFSISTRISHAAVVEPAAELADPGGDPPRLRRLPHLRRGQGAPPAPHQQTGKVSQYQMGTVLI